MADERRTSRKPGRPAAGRSGPRYAERLKAQRKQAARDRQAALVRARAEHQRKSRLTGRAAVLVLVLAVLAVSYASSLRAYLQQREQIDALQETVAQRTDNIDELQRKVERWNDPAYVSQQARERFGYVPKGETPFVTVRNGKPLDASAKPGGPLDGGRPRPPRLVRRRVGLGEGSPATRRPGSRRPRTRSRRPSRTSPSDRARERRGGHGRSGSAGPSAGCTPSGTVARAATPTW
ncbi:septum formation initiator family protein [Nocardioides sp. W3-2-3]|uniref:FtsB family cell division protein n=1 Tax=Nocardioides convexus TaxID=2712224 RepID=UPI00241848D2|nr:septum formation initiator family protein [Nocardioides convexus]NHA00192.1 septum formation initiator family protein [Nocardioides convexus]